ncbi:MAG TPA: SPFH domain-containing protein [Streptosporangiaceae bacterium]|nr:SPFH domain-containing protein [Streptosporangiaceae bacterium]
MAGAIIALIVVVLAILTVLRSVRIVPQARARNIERLGRYRKTLEPGMNFIIPFIDRVKPLIDLREQVVSFKGQPVITEDNLVVLIDTVLFFQVTDPRAADYEIVDYIQAIEQITATMLRSVIGSMDLEQTLTSRDKINNMLRGVLDEASGKWGIRVTRVEIKAIDPPKSVVDAMEKQMRAEREKRAAILNAEGARQSKILTAEGDKQSAILRAEGDKQSQILRAEGQAKAIGAVFQSIHEGNPDPKVLAYQYLQTLPQIAQGQGNTFWVIPSEVTSALKTLSSAFDPDSGSAPTASGLASAAASIPGIPAPSALPQPGRHPAVGSSIQPNGAPAGQSPDLAQPAGAPEPDGTGLPAQPGGAHPEGVPAGPPLGLTQPPAGLEPDGQPDGEQRAEGELGPAGLT